MCARLRYELGLAVGRSTNSSLDGMQESISPFVRRRTVVGPISQPQPYQTPAKREFARRWCFSSAPSQIRRSRKSARHN